MPAASSWTKAWYSEAPRPLRKQPVADMEEELAAAEGGAGTGEDEEEHGEGGDDGDGGESPATVLGFHLISKVFRPEFEARRIERRTGPDHNVTA